MLSDNIPSLGLMWAQWSTIPKILPGNLKNSSQTEEAGNEWLSMGQTVAEDNIVLALGLSDSP